MHKQCPHPDSSSYNIVEVVSGRCEVGQGCPGLKDGCPFAWADNDWRQNRIAEKIFNDFCKRLESR
jgi:hypothetical protein